MANDTMKIAGDTFTVTSNGECAAGPWRIADAGNQLIGVVPRTCLLYTSPSPRDVEESRMPSSA